MTPSGKLSVFAPCVPRRDPARVKKTDCLTDSAASMTPGATLPAMSTAMRIAL
jgi:hypothetical protein